MKKIIALLLTVSLALALFGCDSEPAETTIPTQTTAPAETVPETTVPATTLPQPPGQSVSLNEMLAGTAIELSVEGGTIKLSEDGLTLELSVDSKIIYRDGYVAAVLKDTPAVIGGTVYVHEDFYGDFLCAEDAEEPSVFHGVLFFPEEVLDAIDAPDASVFNQKVAAEVMLPTSMGIEAPHVDMDRAFQYQLLSEYPAVLAQELEELGYESAAEYTYSEYVILSGAQTLFQAGISAKETSVTVAEYQRSQREKSWQTFVDSMTEEQKAFAQEKGIVWEDLSELKQVFYGAYMEQSDDVLKKTLEEYYAADIIYLQSIANEN